MTEAGGVANGTAGTRRRPATSMRPTSTARRLLAVQRRRAPRATARSRSMRPAHGPTRSTTTTRRPGAQCRRARAHRHHHGHDRRRHPQVITVAINGANDAAVITGTIGGSRDRGLRRCQRHGRRRSTGGRRPRATDVDSSATSGGGPATADDGYGTSRSTRRGAWTYTLDNDDAAVQALNTASARSPTPSRSRPPTAPSR